MSILNFVPEQLIIIIAVLAAIAHSRRAWATRNLIQLSRGIAWALFAGVYLYLWLSNVPISETRTLLVRLAIIYLGVVDLINEALLNLFGKRRPGGNGGE